MQKLRKGDTVTVLSGAQKGKRGRVLEVLEDTAEVIVEGLNYRWKHLRKTQQNPQGGRVEKEAPMSIAKVAVVSEETGTPQRVRVVVVAAKGADGRTKRVRYRVGAKDKKPISARDKELADKHGAGS
jgi:large subunit ribosomal protein L24